VSAASAEALVAGALEGAVLHRCLVVFVGAGLPGQLAAGPRPVGALATDCGLHVPSLERVLRFLAAHGVVTLADGVAELTGLGRGFVGGVPGSVAARLAPAWQDLVWAAAGALPASLASGRPGVEIATGLPLFDYLAAHPEAGRAFDGAMARFSAAEDAAIAAAYPFGGHRRIVDVGAGAGGLLGAIRDRHPGLACVQFDRPGVLPVAAGPGVEQVSGDFFAGVPAGGDLYILKRVLHDWDDADVVRILAQVRAVLAPGARLLVIEGLLGDTPRVEPLQLQDLSLLLLTPGRERTLAGFNRLFAQAALRLQGAPVPLPGHMVQLLALAPA
jgi:hypothetical protein